jgi:long-chain acyl-CoA synthetase
LGLSIARRAKAPSPLPKEDVERWLAPTGIVLTALGFALFFLNRLVMRGLFRLRVCGVERLPAIGPFVITPNHASYLDPLAVAAALPWRRLRYLYWAAYALRFFPHPIGRLFSRAAHLFPVQSTHPAAALEIAAHALARGACVVWFPESWRSPDGELQRFLPGIGQLLRRTGVPAVPLYIAGTFAAWPRQRRFPRLRRISVTFGRPEPAEALCTGTGESEEERIAATLRRNVLDLAATSLSNPLDKNSRLSAGTM